jgi:hypothetical protein
MAGHCYRQTLGGGSVRERSLVDPSVLLVKGSGTRVFGNDCEQGFSVSVRSNLPFCLSQ